MSCLYVDFNRMNFESKCKTIVGYFSILNYQNSSFCSFGENITTSWSIIVISFHDRMTHSYYTWRVVIFFLLITSNELEHEQLFIFIHFNFIFVRYISYSAYTFRSEGYDSHLKNWILIIGENDRSLRIIYKIFILYHMYNLRTKDWSSS